MKKSNSAVAILFITLMTVMLGFGIVIPLIPFYIAHFNASGSAIGLMMSLYSLMQFATAPFWGKTSDRIGRKPVLLIGIGGFAVSFFLQGIAQNLPQFIVYRTLAGIISSATLPTAMAYIADTTSEKDRAKGVGMMGAAMGLGMVAGPALGGLLTGLQLPFPTWMANLIQVTTDASTGKLINLSVPYFASALLALIALPLTYFMLPESLSVEQRHAHVQYHTEQPQQKRWQLFLTALRSPIGFFYSMAFILAFALANMETVLALYGKEQFQMGPVEVGLLMGGIGILSAIQQGVMIGPLTRKFGEEAIIRGGLAIGIIGFLGMALSPLKWMFIASGLIFNAGNVLLQPSVTSLISKRANGRQGEAMGLNNAFQSLGRGVGPLWAGFAYDIYSTLSFWTGALIQAGALFYSLKMMETETTLPAGSDPSAAD